MKKSNVKANPFVAADNAVAAAVKDVVAALKKDGVYDFGDKTRLAHLMAEWAQEEFEGSVVIGISKKAIRLQVVEDDAEVDGEKPAKSKSAKSDKPAPEAKGKGKGKPVVEEEGDDDEEDGEEPSGFVYLVFEDGDDAEAFLKAATKKLEENGYEDEDEIEALIGRNGEEGDFVNHIYVDDQIWEETLEAMFNSKKFQATLDDDVEVYTTDAEYLAVVSDAEEGDDEEEDEDDESEEEVEQSSVELLFEGLSECKAVRGQAKAVKELVAGIPDDFDFETVTKWKATKFTEFFTLMESLADSVESSDVIAELYNAVLEDEELPASAHKAITKAFREWDMGDEE